MCLPPRVAGCICPNVTGSTGLHRTSSRSYHTHILQHITIFSVTLYVALTWLDMELTNIAQFCKTWMGAYLLQYQWLLHLFYFLYSKPVKSTLTNSTCPRERQQNNQHTICTHTNRYSTAVSMSSVIKVTIHFINSIPHTLRKALRALTRGLSCSPFHGKGSHFRNQIPTSTSPSKNLNARGGLWLQHQKQLQNRISLFSYIENTSWTLRSSAQLKRFTLW